MHKPSQGLNPGSNPGRSATFSIGYGEFCTRLADLPKFYPIRGAGTGLNPRFSR
jgi:hypothetical protein